MMKIALTQRMFAIVDDEDYKYLNQFKWCAAWNGRTRSFYATRQGKLNGKGFVVAMHRMIFGAENGEIVDHQNHDTLDNRKQNIRLTTIKENSRNQSLRADNITGVTGVSWRPSRQKWVARIRVDGKDIFLGIHSSKEAAIVARKLAEVQHGFHPNHGGTHV